MTLHRYILAGFCVAFLSTSCEKQLELQPAQSIAASSALSNGENVKAALIGAYDALSDVDVWGGKAFRDAEILGNTDQELVFRGTFNGPSEMFSRQISAVNEDVLARWRDTYYAINLTNNVLEGVGKIANETERKKTQGEALFIRAACYFELVRFFGKQYEDATKSTPAVPLILKPTLESIEKKGRNSVEEVYNQVITDLTTAKSLLPIKNGFYANRYAATALLARVYLQKGDYKNAREAAHEVINDGGFTLLAGFEGLFGGTSNTSEDIFAMQITAQDGINDMVTFFANTTKGGRGDLPVQAGHIRLYDATDVRGKFFYTASGRTWTNKWNNSVAQNINVFRLAEMYLIRAEANFVEKTTVGATPLTDINRLRARAKATPLTDVTLNDILMERRLELAFEGFRIHDVKRTKGSVGNLKYDDCKLLFPVPQREINVNDLLTQNCQ